MSLFDLSVFAPGLALTEKGCIYRTILRYTDYLRQHRSTVIDDILAISTLTGQACIDKVTLAYITLLGQDTRTCESAIIAIIIPIPPTKHLVKSNCLLYRAIREILKL